MPRSRLYTSTSLPIMLRGMIIPHAPDEDEGGGQTEAGDSGEDTLAGGAGDDDLGGEESQSGESTEAGGDGDSLAGGAADDNLEEPAAKRVPWQVKRIDKLTAEKNTAETEAQRLREENAALRALGATGGETQTAPTTPPTTTQPGSYGEDEVNRRAEAIAETRVLNEKVNVLYDQVVALDPKFVERQPALREAFAGVLTTRPDFWDAMTQLPNGAAVFNALSKDLDHLDEVLGKSGVALGLELAQISSRLAPKGATVSRAGSTTRPIQPVTDQGKGEMALDDPNLPKEEYQRRRAEAREARFNGQT